ncbi:MAG: hypothetical protein ACRDJW_08960 [Thermomicrobiales bacterium]
MAQEASRQASRAGTSDEQIQELASPEVDARVAVLSSRFGDRLTDEQWTTVRERVEKTIEFGEKLRAVSLTNADEPEIVFVPYRGEAR